MREIIPEPVSRPPEDGASGRVQVAVIALIVGAAAVAAWMERSQKQKAREARYYVVNGSQRLKSSWSRLHRTVVGRGRIIAGSAIKEASGLLVLYPVC